jgi:hypothetical protein
MVPKPNTANYPSSAMPILIRKPLRLLIAATAIILPLLQSAARALPEAEVSTKLDSILMLMAVDTQGSPRAIKATVDGKAANAYLAAMSVAAAEEITAGKRYSVSKQVAATLRFAPVSLAKFYQLLKPLLEKNPKDVGVIAPDPAQISTAEKLLSDQKIPSAQAKQIANLQPMIFCPEPGLLVSFNEGPEKGKQFVPCAAEAGFVESIVQRGIKESPQLAKSNLRVVAIPLNSFVAYLRKEPAERVGQLRIVPSGRLVELVQQLNKQGAKPTPPSK